MNQLFLDGICYAIMFMFAVTITYTVCGFFEALGALLAGDRGPYEEGFMSLNPAAHLDPLGLLFLGICMVFATMIDGHHSVQFYLMLTLVLGRYWLHEVPSNPTRYRSLIGGMCIVESLRIVGCLLVALIGLYGMNYLPYILRGNSVFLGAHCMVLLVTLALWTIVFDLIPLPLFRGWRILTTIAPLEWYAGIAWLEQYAFVVLLLIFVIPVVSDVCWMGMSLPVRGLLYLLEKLVF